MDLPINQVICGDCLEVMKDWPDSCVDLVLTDPPYGSTSCKWDIPPNIGLLLISLLQKTKPFCPVIITAREPLTSKAIQSNKEYYKHKWVWNKKQSGSFQNAKYMPLQIEEDVLVFGVGKVNYYPQMRKGKYRKKGGCKKQNEVASGLGNKHFSFNSDYFPVNIIEIPKENDTIHPTQKPVALMQYLIKTYSQPNDLILDPFCGSGTTCVAAEMLGRRWIGIDISEKYCQIARDRIKAVRTGVPVKEARKGQMGLF